MALENDDIRKLEEFIKRYNTSTEDMIKATKRLVDGFDDSGQAVEDADRQLKNLDKQIKRSGGSFSNVIGDLNRLQETIDEVSETGEDSVHRQRLQTQLDIMSRRAANEQYRKLAMDAGAELVKGLVNYNIARAKALINAVQSDASGFQMAGDIATASLDQTNNTVQGVSKVVGGVGSALTMIPGPARLVGVGLTALAGIAGFVSEKMTELAKFGIEVAVKELEKTTKAYNESANAGAMFADGLTGLRNTAHDANLTVTQFAEVLKTSSTNLAQSGIGVVEGAKQIGRVGKELKASGVQNQLIKLGYSFEEQAAMSAEVIANMRRSAGGTVSDKAVAEQTQKYAENLRLIASLTGEDAKKKVEQVRNENQILAFQQELAKKTPEQRAQIDAAMATMTDLEKKNFRDRVVFGEVINKEGAIYEAQVAGARAKGEAALGLFQNNALTAESNANLNAQYGEQIKQSILSQQALGQAAMATGGVLGDVAKGMLDSLNQANAQTKESVEAGKKSIQEAKMTQDELTKSYVEAVQSGQALKIAIEKELTGVITNFASIANAVLKGVHDQMVALGLAADTVSANLAKTDDANRANMTMMEKAQSYFAGALESIPQGIGKALSAIGMTDTGKAVSGLGDKAQVERQKSETEYLNRKDRSKDAAKVEEKFDKTATTTEKLADGLARGVEAVGGFAASLTGFSFLGDLVVKAQEERLKSEREAIAEKEKNGGKVKMKTGGVIEGPEKGFNNVELHGTEAVVPLPGGRAIPVDIKGGIKLASEMPGQLMSGMGSYFSDLTNSIERVVGNVTQPGSAGAGAKGSIDFIKNGFAAYSAAFDNTALGIKSIFTDLSVEDKKAQSQNVELLTDTFNTIKNQAIQGITNLPFENAFPALKAITSGFEAGKQFDPVEMQKAIEQGMSKIMQLTGNDNQTAKKTDIGSSEKAGTAELIAKVDQLISVMNDQKELMRKSFDKTDDMVNILDGHKDLTQQLVNNSF